MKVGSVLETCNKKEGYDINLSSQNMGNLVNQSDVSSKVKYSINYGTSISPSNSLETVSTTVKSETNLTGKTQKTSEVFITFPASPEALAGEYTDTLTVSIIAK